MARDARTLSKTVQKHASRAKERIFQNLGKADRTTDDVLNMYISNFNKQHACASRLAKEVKNYAGCARALQAAHRSLMEAIADSYEAGWPHSEQMPLKSQVVEMMWDDLCHKIHDQVAVPIATYLGQFPTIRNKIAKRGRKLVDFDKCRHNLQSLQQPGRRRDELKIGKAKEKLDNAKRLYESINDELHIELPALYDNRVTSMASQLQTLFAAEHAFHGEEAAVFGQLLQMADTLADDAHRGKFATSRTHFGGKSEADMRHYEEIEFKRNQLRANKLDTFSKPGVLTARDHSPRDRPITPLKGEKDYEPVDVKAGGDRADELYDIPVGATTTDLPSGVLYRVRSTYKYSGEDVDELTFEIGDIIRVVEYDDPEEQEEGWLMGVKEATGEKGLFPANFTRPI